jgi:hypothetical protein
LDFITLDPILSVKTRSMDQIESTRKGTRGLIPAVHCRISGRRIPFLNPSAYDGAARSAAAHGRSPTPHPRCSALIPNRKGATRCSEKGRQNRVAHQVFAAQTNPGHDGRRARGEDRAPVTNSGAPLLRFAAARPPQCSTWHDGSPEHGFGRTKPMRFTI